jgi:bacteriocin-like protein
MGDDKTTKSSSSTGAENLTENDLKPVAGGALSEKDLAKVTGGSKQDEIKRE